MNGAIYTIDLIQMAEFLANMPVTEEHVVTLLEAGRFCEPLLVGTFNSEVICFVGFIPLSFLSDAAHIWIWIPPGAARHSLLIARYSRIVIQQALTVYSKIIGYSNSDTARSWLKWLGAEFDSDTGVSHFEIRRA